MKILIIDDNISITKMMQKYFLLSKNDCMVVNSGRTGLALILDQKFDVILLDLAMPEFDGYDVVETLSKMGKIKTQKIILLTASNVSKEDTTKLFDLGIHSCITKPVSMEVLLSAMTS